MMDEFGMINPDNVELLPGAKETILELEKEHEIYFLTSKRKDMEAWTRVVLQREGLAHIRLVNNMTDNKAKDEYLYDVLIDDNPNIAHYKKLILFDRPWNRYVKTETRISSWSELKGVLYKYGNCSS
jgi:hypothetical protein